MNFALRHLRPLLISVVALILTAGIALAAKPSTPAHGQDLVGQASGQTVTTETETTETVTTDTETPDTETKDTETTTTTAETSDAGSHCTTDPTKAAPNVLAGLNHGAIVCWAAHQPTPNTFANHGAWVSHWAKANKGATHAAAGKAHQP